MGSRQDIIQTLRDHATGDCPLPDLEHPWTTYRDLHRQFAEALEAAGGRCVVVDSAGELSAELERTVPFREAKTRCSLVPTVVPTGLDLETVADPHDLRDLDFCIAPGQFGVAENGAVWVTDQVTSHRVAYFIAQHLALVVPYGEIVHNLHQAYERLEFQQAQFGVFISGPSKTADIEQSLVLGAHGARSLTVFLLRTGEVPCNG